MNKTYYQQYYESNRTKRIRDSRTYHKNTRRALITLLGGKCKQCGFTDIRALQIDHVNGGGAKEKRMTKNFYNYMLNKAINGSKDYQVLCANCNWIKRAVNNENNRSEV